MPQRLKSATARMEKIPTLFAQMRENLDPARVPKIHAETVAKQNAGVLSLIDTLHHPATPTSCRARTASSSTPPSPACARRSPSSRSGSTRPWCPTPRATSASARRCTTRSCSSRSNSSLSRAEIKQRAEAELKRVRGEMYAHRADRAEGQGRRAGDAGRRRRRAAAEGDRSRAGTGLRRPPGARQGGRLRQADAGRRDRSSRARSDLVTVPERSGQDHPDAGIPARRRGRVLRFAGPARQGPGHLLRDLADPGRLDARSRSTRSCANTTAA